MAARLRAVGIEALPISFSRPPGGGDLSPQMEDVRRARDALLASGVQRFALVGRSFGGRVCTRLAALERPDALVLLGHPIAPPNRPRPEDESALAAVRCPTLIVQGDHDRLGPLDVLRRIADGNTCIEVYVLEGVGHQFGKRQAEGVDYAARWLAKRMES
jgi:predicted alpha/beta-hydrolase family hydrolase